jgi:putative peptide zinc metalloprotease protein
MTDTPVLSSLWYRVENLRPRLRSHARLHRHRYRGEVWYLLQDPASGRVQRFSAGARLIIALMDGKRTVADLWESANRQLGEAAPTQDEMIQLLGQLHAADLLQSDVTPDVAELFARHEKEVSAKVRRSYGNPMAIRIPLLDPDRFLNRFQGLIRLLWGPVGAAIWCLTVIPAVLLIAPYWDAMSNGFTDRVLSMDNLIVLYFAFPVIKALHELGHAMAIKARGGEVHEMGVLLLVLLPVPYVEASAATTFRSKYHRAIVGSAGVIVELFIAAIAFYLWILMEPGVTRAVLFNVMLIAGISTLIFNGNPLLRYDAYYIMADLLEIPNLASRSLRYWSYLLERHVLGARNAEPPHASRSEKAWLLFYGFASTIYRVFITVLIALFIAGQFFFIGILLALWAVGAMVALPLIKGIRHLATSPRLRGRRRRAVVVIGGALATIAAFIAFVPIPYHSHAQGVVWLPEQALVRAASGGFVEQLLVRAGTAVKPGDALLRLSEPALHTHFRVAQAKVTELEALHVMEAATDRVKAAVIREKLRQERATLAVASARAADLTVHAKTEGVFMVPNMEDMPGRYYRKGELIGHVIGPTQPRVRVVVPQEATSNVRLATDQVKVRVMNRAHTVHLGRISREFPAGDEYLPSKAFALEGGGLIATDPRDTKGPKALQRMFQFDVVLEDAPPFALFGQRVLLRFEHAPEPLGEQWYRSFRLLFLSRFSV